MLKKQRNTSNSTKINPLSIVEEKASLSVTQNLLTQYQNTLSENSLKRQRNDLALFARFLNSEGAQIGDLYYDISSWSDVSWSLVEAFKSWQVDNGYSISSINVRLSTFKSYSKLAARAGIISYEEQLKIQAIRSYSRREEHRINARRELTRQGHKKAKPTEILPHQVKALKSQPQTSKGLRDGLIMCLLLDHGLRVSELGDIKISDLDMKNKHLHFYRKKVRKFQTHILSNNTFQYAEKYLSLPGIKKGTFLIRIIKSNGEITPRGISERGLAYRVTNLGELVGIDRLSPHDCRHHWATVAARSGTDLFTLQEAGGWSSLRTPRMYVQENHIANEGLKLNYIEDTDED